MTWSWIAAFSAINAASGIFLLFLGIYAAFHPQYKNRLTLPLFLMAWGTQAALTNIAATQDHDSAKALYILGNCFLPFQAFLLLTHAADRAKSSHSVVRRISISAALILLGFVGAALLLPFTNPEQLLRVETDSQSSVQVIGEWAPYVYYFPQFVGVALALLLLGVMTHSTASERKEWQILCGLLAMWAYLVAYNLPGEPVGTPLWFALITALGIMGIAWAILVSRAYHGERGQGLIHSGLFLLTPLAVFAAAWSGGLGAGWQYVAVSPGSIRIVLGALLAWALWHTEFYDLSQARLVPLLVLALAVTSACTLFYLENETAYEVGESLLASAMGLALSALIIIGLIAAAPTWHAMRKA